MANALFHALGGNRNAGSGELPQFMAALSQFKQNFHGDPKQKVQELLNSGQMTQAQFNQLAQMTDQIIRTMSQP